MSLLRVPGQNITFQGPDNGEVWTNSNRSTIFRRVGNTIQQVNVNELGFAPGMLDAFKQVAGTNVQYGGPYVGYYSIDGAGNKQGMPAWVRNQAVAAALKTQGIDLNAISQPGYDADLPQWFQSGIFNSSNITGNVSALAQPVAQGGPEVFTKAVSPDNPNGIKVTNDTTGQVVTQSPTAQEALQSAGASQAQAQALAAAQQNSPTLSPTQIAQAAPGAIPNPTPATPAPTATPAPASATPVAQPTLSVAAPSQTVLTPEQQTAYFASQSKLPNPLSPAQWLATQSSAQAPASSQNTGVAATPSSTVATPSTATVAPQATSTGTQGTATTPVLPTVNNTQYDAQFQKLLDNPNLTADQRKAIETIFHATSTNDTALATKFLSAMNASTEFSSPYFKAMASLVSDSLTRGLASNEGDLNFKQKQLQDTLSKLRSDTSASIDQLDFTHQQELKNLQLSLEKDLQDNAQGLAATGKTHSSIRARTDQLLNQNTNGLVESKNRTFSFQKGNLNSDLSTNTTNTADQIAYLKDQNTQKRIAALREAESKIGSDALSKLGFGGLLLGNIFGSIPEQQQEQSIAAGRLALNGSPSFIF